MRAYQKAPAPSAGSASRSREDAPARPVRQGQSCFLTLRDFGAETGRELRMPPALLDSMGDSYRTDFTRMRFYESPSLPAIHAKALTRGNRSLFAPGCFSPESQSGRGLIGHELSHAAAQSRGVGSGSGLLWHAGLEARADREGARAARGERVSQAPPTTAGLRSNAPAQGYFTLLPGDYTLASDGDKAAFATHTYKNYDPNDPDDLTLEDYTDEFSAPRAEGARAPVPDADPGSGDAAIQALHQMERSVPPVNPRRQFRTRLEAHRRLADGFDRTLGSGNPAFREKISSDETRPVGRRFRYAAIGVHKYEGKTALYVADDGSFAVNAQTTEPKEAYMGPDAIARAAGRGGNVALVPFPGNRIDIPPPEGEEEALQLQMVRPSFDGDYAKGSTYDCGDFAGAVCPSVWTGGQDPTPARVTIARSNPKAAMIRAGMMSSITGMMRSMLLIAPQSVKTLAALESHRERAVNGGTPLDRNDATAAFMQVFEDEFAQRLRGERFEESGYSALGADISESRWGNVQRPNDPDGDPPSGLAGLRNHGAFGVTNMLSRLYFGRQRELYADAMMGDSAQTGTDVDRVMAEEEQYGADDRARGINAHARPAAGQAYQISTTLGDGWAYHWGGVVAGSAGDTLTLENYHKDSELQVLRMAFAREQEGLLAEGFPPDGPDMARLLAAQERKRGFFDSELKKTWFFNIQGTVKPGQSFHAKQAATGAYGAASVTLAK